jgi:hypothetical protein
MAGDLGVRERSVLEAATLPAAAMVSRQVPGPTIHRYGRVSILAVPERAAAAPVAGAEALREPPDGLDEIEQLGFAALQLRESESYLQTKRNRPRADEPWDMPSCSNVMPPPRPMVRAVGALSAGPTSSYLEGTVAVGIIIVQGPTAGLKFSAAERTQVVAEVQNGLGFYPTTNPIAGISFSYDIQNVTLSVPADPNAPDLEAHWRDPAMAAIGFSADWNGVLSYVEDLRLRLGTRWT